MSFLKKWMVCAMATSHGQIDGWTGINEGYIGQGSTKCPSKQSALVGTNPVLQAGRGREKKKLKGKQEKRKIKKKRIKKRKKVGKKWEKKEEKKKKEKERRKEQENRKNIYLCTNDTKCGIIAPLI